MTYYTLSHIESMNREDWPYHINKWINKLSNPQSSAERRCKDFLKRSLTDIDYFKEALKEMQRLISRPNTNYKYFYFFDVELLESILNDFNHE